MKNLLEKCNVIEAYFGYKVDSQTFDLEIPTETLKLFITKLKNNYKNESYFLKRYYYKNMIYSIKIKDKKQTMSSYKFINLEHSIEKHNNDLDIFYGQNLKILMDTMDFPCKLDYHYIDQQNVIEFIVSDNIKVYILDEKIKFEVTKQKKNWENDVKTFQNLITSLNK